MTAAPLPADLRAAAPGVARRLGVILAALAALVARALLRHPIRAALTVPLWTRLTRAARRFDRLMARLAAGTPSRRARSGRSGPRAALPSGHAWLVVALRHEAAAFASQLDHLLAEPATAALLAASPQAASILRPICRMLGLRPAALPPKPHRERVAPAATLPVTPAVAPAVTLAAPTPPPRLLAPLRVLTRPRPRLGWPGFPHPSAKPI